MSIQSIIKSDNKTMVIFKMLQEIHESPSEKMCF